MSRRVKVASRIQRIYLLLNLTLGNFSFADEDMFSMHLYDDTKIRPIQDIENDWTLPLLAMAFLLILAFVLKKQQFKELSVIMVSLISSYAVLVAALYVAIFGLAYLLFELVFLTLEQPTVWVILADIIVTIGLVFVITRQMLWDSIKDVWRQILKNL